jgi:cold-inducible RNA-binding protein
MRIFVANISFTTTEDELERLFEPYGIVDRAQIITDRDTGRSRGFAFVEMPNGSEAQAAIDGLNGTSLGGRQLTVNEAREREDRGGPRREPRRFDFVTVSTRRIQRGGMARGRKTLLTIRLTPAERLTLLTWQRATTISAGVARRARLLLLLADGMTITAAAATVGLSRRHAYKWIRRFVQEGLAGLHEQPRHDRRSEPRPPDV